MANELSRPRGGITHRLEEAVVDRAVATLTGAAVGLLAGFLVNMVRVLNDPSELPLVYLAETRDIKGTVHKTTRGIVVMAIPTALGGAAGLYLSGREDGNTEEE
jgi:hypothetical protein